MDLATLRRLIADGENQHLELKRKLAHPEKVVREVVAFANASGGLLVVGVDDNLTIAGLADIDGEEYVLERALNELCEPVPSYALSRVVCGPDLYCLLCRVKEAPVKPTYVKEDSQLRAYIRVADRSVQASREVRQVLKEQQKPKQYQFAFGPKEKLLLEFLSRYKSITLPDFARRAQVPERQAGRTLVLLVLANILTLQPAEGNDIYTLNPTFEEHAV